MSDSCWLCETGVAMIGDINFDVDLKGIDMRTLSRWLVSTRAGTGGCMVKVASYTLRNLALKSAGLAGKSRMQSVGAEFFTSDRKRFLTVCKVPYLIAAGCETAFTGPSVTSNSNAV